ncbi:hypothetical protein LR948_18805 [Roseivivax sp. GX 12232]|uniref:hypothetical protein n=1 Tax=Roseivivax sp. GX 12232 TaxID=2900547 RepID=UPI001E3D37E6|nr:hypothetical protein [Roseivivax sp. GX 12232]MCE0507407.1 hypothetical protein [Roseivivax sp. GX 12232]
MTLLSDTECRFRLLVILALTLVPLAGPGIAQERGASAAQATVPAAAEAGGIRRWRLLGEAPVPLRSAPNEEAAPATKLAPGTILSNLGCEALAREVWCTVAPLSGGPRGHLPVAQLAPAEGPDGVVARGLDDSAARAKRGDFDLRAEVACAQNPGEPMGRCTIRSARGSGGDATLVATFQTGFRRTLTFAHGQFLRGNATMSGVGTDTDWRLEDGLHLIRVDDQRFEVPDRLISGE